MHTSENKIIIKIEGIPHIAIKHTVTILIGIITFNGNASLLYA